MNSQDGSTGSALTTDASETTTQGTMSTNTRNSSRNRINRNNVNTNRNSVDKEFVGDTPSVGAILGLPMERIDKKNLSSSSKTS